MHRLFVHEAPNLHNTGNGVNDDDFGCGDGRGGICTADDGSESADDCT
jgi:hypothetical protein